MNKVLRFFKAILVVCRYGQDAVFRDSLTGLYNRLFLEMISKNEIERGKRYGLTLVMIDIDGLRETNNTLGHPEGDKLLKRVARTLASQCRKADLVFRWGGDEFLMLLPGTDLIGASEVLERISVSFMDEDIQVSYGLASLYSKEEFISMEDLIREADDMMYQNKNQKKGLRQIYV